MPFSHHSHSGQFCTHATSSLEQVVLHAIASGMTTFALTEHIPRADIDLYSDESSHHLYTVPGGLWATFDAYCNEAIRLRTKYEGRIKLLVGFETEWIRPESRGIVGGLLGKYRFDLFVGSLHHVHTFPIDYDDETFAKARDVAGGEEERLFEDYFDAQLEMLEALRPPVVGHFDLIRLKAARPDRDWREMGGVWERIVRNLRVVREFGGLMELNTSALRKGLREPYPRREIVDAFLEMGGRFTLSDDSHGVEHVGTNYARVMEFVRTTGIKEICYIERTGATSTRRLDDTVIKAIGVRELMKHGFWKKTS